MKSSNFDDDILLPVHMTCFPHIEVLVIKYLSECNVILVYSELNYISTSPPPQNSLISDLLEKKMYITAVRYLK